MKKCHDGFPMMKQGGAGERKRVLPCFSPDHYIPLLAAQDEPGAVGRGVVAVSAQGPL